MVKNTNLDVESRAPEQCMPTELDSLIRRDVPNKKQAWLAFFQFLAFCSALFMVGWTDGSTGPLLPTIREFYDVCWFKSLFCVDSYVHEFCRSGSEQYLGYLFRIVPSVDVCWWGEMSSQLILHHFFQGMVVGALLNMPLADRLGLGNVGFYARYFFTRPQVNVPTLGSRPRGYLTDFSFFRRIS